jgi:glucosamine--fructose-6-phosphate aminotransferase (isomerizing)
MCGIVGYIGKQEAVPVLIRGLEHLEYRGYDSAGIACLNGRRDGFLIVKEKGKLSFLKEELRGQQIHSQIGIGHTRWATHGEPSRLNAHPHTDSENKIALVHNGIIENFSELREELKRNRFICRSETDTEVAANLIGYYYKKSGGQILEAVHQAVKRMRGFYAFAVIAKEHPDQMIAFKRSNPLVIGLGKDAHYVASDTSALLPYTNRVVFLEDDEYAVLKRDSLQIFSIHQKAPIRRKPMVIRWNIAQAQKGGYKHFMLKEIHEQPVIMEETITKRLDRRGKVHFDTLCSRDDRSLRRVEKVFFVSCGTAYHAGIVGKYLMEDVARLPAEAQVSSEFRYGDPILSKRDMVVLITQSGETADTLAALREAKAKGAFTLAVVNVVGSTIAREADAVIYTHAGPEIGVASTKAYTAQLLTLVFFAAYMAQLRKTARLDKALFAKEVRKLPEYCKLVLKQDKAVERCARRHYRWGNFLYLGRGYNYATALEGALKLKEISYAHAHGYAAGEMKHGPIALIDNKQPVICIAPEAKTYEKMISNIQEIKARAGIIISIGTRGDQFLSKISSSFFTIPKTLEMFTPILSTIPLQLLAYKISDLNGRDVDQPRNLAKSVTVE